MLAIVGILLVFAAIIAGFLMEKGHMPSFFSLPNC